MRSDIWTKFKKFLFPVKRGEIKSFLPLFLLYFCLSFIYNGLRPLKITLVTSVSDAGAEIIPYLKVWGIMPGAFFFTYLFVRFLKIFTREQIFYLMMSIFLVYYFVFAVWIYPNSEFLTLDSLAAILHQFLPSGFRGFISMLQYWHVSLFYVFCEVWSSAVMFMLFWGYVNEVTPMERAPRFYPFYNLGGNLASTASGFMVMEVAKNNFILFGDLGKSDRVPHFPFTIIMISVFLGLFGMLCFWFANKNNNKLAENEGRIQEKKKNKIHFTLKESFVHVSKSKYLLFLLVLVIAYNLVFNLTDVLWSQQVKNLYGSDQIKMTGFMGQVTMYKGILSTVLVFGAHFVINKYGWLKTTLLTPGIILASSLFFYPLVFFEKNDLLQGLMLEMFSTSALGIAVLIGGMQNALTRGTKYSLYDTTKEMAFIPLTTDMKRKGKAVIDGIASRIGKSSGSIIYMILLPFCSSLSATTPYIAVIAILVTIFWVYCVYGLNKLMQQEIKKNKQQKSQAERI